MRRDGDGEHRTSLETAGQRIKAGPTHDLLYRAHRPHASLGDQHDRRGEPGDLGGGVADIDDRHDRTVAQALEIWQDFVLARGVERGQRLVHQQ